MGLITLFVYFRSQLLNRKPQQVDQSMSRLRF